jgi:hypothetical protein
MDLAVCIELIEKVEWGRWFSGINTYASGLDKYNCVPKYLKYAGSSPGRVQ